MFRFVEVKQVLVTCNTDQQVEQCKHHKITYATYLLRTDLSGTATKASERGTNDRPTEDRTDPSQALATGDE